MSIRPLKLSFPSSAPIRPGALLVGAALAFGSGLLLAPWYLSSSPRAHEPLPRRTLTVTAGPIVASLNEVGSVQPGSHLTVTAPFDGFISELWEDLGARVESGAPLLAMDTSELDGRLRDAESALLKASAACAELDRWSDGPEMSRAKRTLATASAQLASLDQQEKQAKTLLNRGIISRNEYDGIRQQVTMQGDQVASAEQDLKAATDHGNERNRRLAEIELTAARASFDEMTAQRARDVVRAPKAGILMRPPTTSSDRTEGAPLGRGSHLSRGQAVSTIADLSSLIVEMRADEIDVNQIHVGQPAMMESDSFPGDIMRGTIVSVGGEADASASLGGSAHFLVKAHFIADVRDQATVRIGMSARVTIVTYDKPSAISIPEEAVTIDGNRRSVQLLDPQTGIAATTEVALGTPTPSGVEIVSGLKAGDELVLP